MERKKPLRRTPLKAGTKPLKRGPINPRSKKRQEAVAEAKRPPLTDVPWWLAVDGQRAKMLVDKTCRVCGHPAVSFHHVPPRSWGGLNCADAGAPVCGDGTKGCHGLIEAMDDAARRAYGANMTGDEKSYVVWLLGDARGRAFLADRYFVAVPPLWPLWRGAAHFDRPKVVFDE